MSNSEKHKNKEVKQKSLRESFQLFEYLVGAAREQVATSNSSQKDCYSPSQIRQMVRSKELPAGKCLDHLTDCAKCFKEYRFALEVAKQTSTGETKLSWIAGWRDRLTFNRAGLAWSFGLILAVCGLSAVLFFALKPEQSSLPPEIVQNTAVETNIPPLNTKVDLPPAPKNTGEKIEKKKTENSTNPNSNTEKTANLNNTPDVSVEKPKTASNKPLSGEKKNTPISPKPGKSSTFYLDLSETETLRKSPETGSGENSEPRISGDIKSLKVKTPAIYHRKNVRFSMVDSFGKAIYAGKTLIKNENLVLQNPMLQKFRLQTVRICLQLETEIPECFPIKIK